MSAQACIAAEPESLRCYSDPVARVAEQADAHGSGPCARKGVGVQLPPRAQQRGSSYTLHRCETPARGVAVGTPFVYGPLGVLPPFPQRVGELTQVSEAS